MLAQFIRSIDANRTMKDRLAAAVGASRPRRRISVTDLVNPRQSYFRWTHPEIKPPPERLAVMLAGTGFHDIFGKVVSSEEFLEQLLEMDGIVGKVDIYQDVPVELKTTSSIPSDIYRGRGSYFEQLGMYCAMAGSPVGQLIVYRRESSEFEPELRAYEARFGELEKIAQEMLRRRDLFQAALEQDDPSALPRCEWYWRGCDYLSICGCGTAEPQSPVVARQEVEITERGDIAENLRERLSAAPTRSADLRLNDLVFPRKASLRRTQGPEEDDIDEVPPEERLADMQRQGFKDALYSAMRYGSPGQFKRVPVNLGTIVDRVQTLDGVPTILRAVRLRDMVPRERLSRFFSHYFDRMAFECALTGSQRGRLVLYYEAMPGDRFMVYDVSLTQIDQILAEAERRLGLLESGAPHTELPPCPAWMAKRCEFAAVCGCGSSDEGNPGVQMRLT